MKAMIIADLMMSKSTTIQQILVPLLISLFICIGMQSLFVVPVVVIISVGYSRMFTLLALDEQNGWQRYRTAMPANRAQIMTARCASLLILALIACVFSAILSAFLAAILPPIMQGLGFADFTLDFNLPLMALMTAIGLLITAVLVGVTLPLYARFGMTKALGYLPLLFMIVAMVCLGFIGQRAQQNPRVFETLITSTPDTTTLAVLVAAALVFVLTSALAVALYRKRQF